MKYENVKYENIIFQDSDIFYKVNINLGKHKISYLAQVQAQGNSELFHQLNNVKDTGNSHLLLVPTSASASSGFKMATTHVIPQTYRRASCV